MNLKTKNGLNVFSGIVAIAKEGFGIAKQDGKFMAISKKGEVLGEIVGESVFGDKNYKHTDARKEFALTALIPAIDPASLVGKDPMTLSKEELVVLTQYLQEMAAGKLNVPANKDKEAKKEAKAADEKADKKVKKGEKPAKKEAPAKVELPEGITSYEDLAALGSKELWKNVVKAIAEQLEGISSRSKKDEMLEAAAKYFGLTPAEEEEDDELDEDELPESMSSDDEDEEDYDEEEDDEDEEDDSEEEDEDDTEDDDESEDDEEDDEESDDEVEDDDDEDEDDEEDDEDEDDDEEEEEDEDDDKLTPADIDAMETKEEIMAVIKAHKIKLPKKKLSVGKVKAFIKQALFGDDE